MSRTGGTVSRKSTTSTKSRERKSAAKRSVGTSRSNPAPARGSRAKPAPKSSRHGIGTPTKTKASARPSRAAKPERRKATAAPSPKMKKTDSKQEMKRTTPDKPKAATIEKAKPVKAKEPAKAVEKEPVKVKEPAKIKAAAPAPTPVPPVAKETKIKAPKAAAKPTTVKVDLPPETADEATRRKGRTPRETNEPGSKPKGSRSRASKIPGFDELMQDYVMDEEAEEEETQDEMALDPLELPLELLDPELVEVPRPNAPTKPKQKVATANRRQQACAHCGNMYNWLSVDQLCFNCLKKKLAQRKREDESYSGFTPEAEEEEDFS